MKKMNFLFLLPMVIFISLFIIYPYFNIIKNSFTEAWTGKVTFQNYKNIVINPQYFIAWKNSVLFVGGSTLIAAFFGSIIGRASIRFSERVKNMVSSLFALPITLSGLVVAFAFIVLLGRTGIVNIFIKTILKSESFSFNLYSWNGLLVVYAFFNIPLFSITMIGAFENLNISLVDAARNLGANTLQVWIHVIIPTLAPAFLTATSLVFATMMGAFGTVLALTGMSRLLLSLSIYSNTSESTFNIPQADVLAILLGITTIIGLFLLNWVEKKIRG